MSIEQFSVKLSSRLHYSIPTGNLSMGVPNATATATNKFIVLDMNLDPLLFARRLYFLTNETMQLAQKVRVILFSVGRVVHHPIHQLLLKH